MKFIASLFSFFRTGKSGLIQPLLTAVLGILLVVLVIQFFAGRSKSNEADIRQIARKVSFDEAVETFQNGTFQIYTRGALIVKNDVSTPSLQNKSVDPLKKEATEKSINATETKYDDLFFFTEKGKTVRVDYNTYGQRESVFYDKKDGVVFQSNTLRSYTTYPVPSDDEKDAALYFSSLKQIISDVLPFNLLIEDYKAGKFTPYEVANNLYSGKWQHPLFTSNEVVDVLLQTDGDQGYFRSFSVAHAFVTVPSTIYFDFKPTEIKDSLRTVAEGYKEVERQNKYKSKS